MAAGDIRRHETIFGDRIKAQDSVRKTLLSVPDGRVAADGWRVAPATPALAIGGLSRSVSTSGSAKMPDVAD
jgi:hypothetical protein